MLFLLKPVRLGIKALLTESTPRQLSMGFALGILLGLVPKGNLLAIGLGIMVAALRINLGVAAAAALAATFAGVWLDPVSDRVGTWLLSHPALQSFWTQLYNTPLMPWTDFNNSVVIGSLLIGLVLVYPLHRLSHPLFVRYSTVVGERARRWRLARLLLGAEWADRLGSLD
ncbi:MAG: TIGR03546 family protein [Planctomycetaceae bacterium]|nr:TIGR03546 family protein [Planctomycetaceae bacterium]